MPDKYEGHCTNKPKAKSENLSQTAAIAEPNIDPQIERVLSANLSEAPSFVPSIFFFMSRLWRVENLIAVQRLNFDLFGSLHV